MQRHLTPKETNVLRLLKYVEALADSKSRRLGGTLTMTDEAIAAMYRCKAAHPYRVVRDGNTEMSSCRFTLIELFKYVHYCCEQVGMRVNLDGSISTEDGRTLTVEDVH